MRCYRPADELDMGIMKVLTPKTWGGGVDDLQQVIIEKKETLCNVDVLFMIRPGLGLRERLKHFQGLCAYRYVSPATW